MFPEFSEDCSRASTRKICPKRKSHEKATKKPRKSNEKGPNTVFLDRSGPRKSHEKTTKKLRVKMPQVTKMFPEFVFCQDYRANGRAVRQTAGGYSNAFPRLKQPLFAVSASRELESASRVVFFVRCCHSTHSLLFRVLRGSRGGGQQQFATQTLRVHLLGLDLPRLPKRSAKLLKLFCSRSRLSLIDAGQSIMRRAKRVSYFWTLWVHRVTIPAPDKENAGNLAFCK